MEKSVNILNSMVRDGIIQDYAIGGAIAALFYAEPVETFDLDVFVVIQQKKSSIISLEHLYRYLKDLGYKSQKECVMIEGVPVQFLVPYNSLIEEALDQAVSKKIGQEPVRVFRAEHLLAIMAQTGRPKDKIRIQILLKEAKYDATVLDGILRRHLLVARWKIIGGGSRGQ